MIEIGNLLFGNSRGKYEFPDRKFVNSKSWRDLVEVLGADDYMYIPVGNQWHSEVAMCDDEGQWTFYDKAHQKLFQIFPYYWGEDEVLQARHNFVYKPGTSEELAIDWYKYPFRDAYVSRPVSKTILKRMFEECTAAVKAAKGE